MSVVLLYDKMQADGLGAQPTNSITLCDHTVCVIYTIVYLRAFVVVPYMTSQPDRLGLSVT